MKFKIYTLGCKVNTYESTVIKELLEKAKYIEDENPDICIINTCTVTNTADKKSGKMIRSLKRRFPDATIVVMGCYTQNKKDIDADIVIGNTKKSKIVEILKEYNNKKINKVEDVNDIQFEDMILNNFDLTRAYIKIEDGCENFCTYCIIPYVRGNIRCKKRETILLEASNLIRNGHKEIVLTGIHTGHYKDENTTFSNLLEDLCKIKGLERLRISSIEVTELDDDFLEVLEKKPIIVDHMHIPLQSGSNKILKDMNRKYDKDYFIKKIEKIRKIRPNISVTTDVIVGFPGETEDLFNETIETINKIQFTKLHVFPYSDREGTKASLMDGHIDEVTKKQRVKKLLEISNKLENIYMDKFINKEVTIIKERYKDGFIIGHTGNFLLVKIKTDEKEKLNVKIIDKEYPYLIGKEV